MDTQQHFLLSAAEQVDEVGTFEMADCQRDRVAAFDRGQTADALGEVAKLGDHPAPAGHVKAEQFIVTREGMSFVAIEHDFGHRVTRCEQRAVIVEHALRPAEAHVGDQHQDFCPRVG